MPDNVEFTFLEFRCICGMAMQTQPESLLTMAISK